MKKLISVSGLAHSGTTLTATIIGAHPNVHLIPKETYWFSKEWYAYGDARNALDYLSSNVKEDYVLEKTPVHVRYLDDIELLLPDTSFIVTVRDPRDIVWSYYKRTNDWDKSIEECQIDFEIIRGLRRTKFPCKVIRYEDLISNFDTTVKIMCKHIGINFNKRMLSYYKYAPNWFANSGGAHEKMRASQVKKSLFDGRSKWIGNLSDSQLQEIHEEIVPYSKYFGYSWNR